MNSLTVNMQDLLYLNVNKQKFICTLIILAFLTKIPVFPFHYWLIEAHVESPTSCSAILAALY